MGESEDDWEQGSQGDNWEEEENEEEWKKEDNDDDWEQGVNSKDATSETTPKSSLEPGSPKSGAKERLLPAADKSMDVKTINSFADFEVKTMSDVDHLINGFIKPKLFPANPDNLKAKKAHAKILNLAVDGKGALMELKEMEKIQTQLGNLVKQKKSEILEADKAEKKRLAEEDAKLKAELEEAKKKEAEEKGETYVNDEDFFAGLE